MAISGFAIIEAMGLFTLMITF